MSPTRFVIITPVRNEEAFLPSTIANVAAQTIRPTEWMIVNDGSTDRTGEIADNAAKQYSWIHVLHRADRGFRKSGGGVMETFHDGYAKLQTKDWDFIVKLDGDLTFSPDYFGTCFDHFRRNPKLGIGGGLVCLEQNGKLLPDAKSDPEFHVRGATKIYRRTCWDAIGGLILTTGWDTMDEIKSNMLGWKTYTFPEARLIHHRVTGGADGAWRDFFKNGRANYIVGYHPFFMASKCLRRALRNPGSVAPVALWCGYFTGYFSRLRQRTEDQQLIRYLRREQIRALFGKKCLWNAYEKQ